MWVVSRWCRCVCALTAICAVASVHRQPFVPLHRATALCGCLYASLHNGFVWLSLCILAYRLFATTCKHPCLKPLGVHFRHPCLACPSRYINRRHYRKLCNLSAKHLKSFLPLTDFVLYSITQDQISLSAKIVFLKKPPQKRWLKKLFT